MADEPIDLSGRKRRLEDMSVDERLQRSRERNREHARRTRRERGVRLGFRESRRVREGVVDVRG